MISWLKNNRLIYIASNLLVIPAIFVPNIDFLSNISFIIAIFFLLKKNIFHSLVICFILILKNNVNYRFNLLIKIKGVELSKSDNECVYLYAWSTLLRYILIAAAVNQIFLLF